MSNSVYANISVMTGSKSVVVNNSVDVSNFKEGDVIHSAGNIPLVVFSSTSNSLTLRDNSHVTLTNADVLIEAGDVPVRNLGTQITALLTSFTAWFTRMEAWTKDFGTISVLSPGGIETQISTIPQLVSDVSDASDTIAANIVVIGEAAQNADDAEAAATTSTQQAQISIDNRVLGEQAVVNAEQAVTDSNTIKSQTQALLSSTETAKDAADQAVIDASVQVGLAADQVALAEAENLVIAGLKGDVETLKSDTLVFRNDAEQFKIDAQNAVQSVSGAMFPAGSWDASTNNLPATPANGSPYYIIINSGTLGGMQANMGDTLYWNSVDGVWFLVDNTSEVFSVNGEKGTVILDAADVGARDNSWVPSWTQVTSKPTTFAPANHNANKITSGTLPIARGGTGRSDGKSVGWATTRTLTLSGDASGSVNIDGSGNMSLSVTVNDDSHNHVISNIDGLQTALNAKANSSQISNFTNVSRSNEYATNGNNYASRTALFNLFQYGETNWAGGGMDIVRTEIVEFEVSNSSSSEVREKIETLEQSITKSKTRINVQSWRYDENNSSHFSQPPKFEWVGSGPTATQLKMSAYMASTGSASSLNLKATVELEIHA